VSDTASEIPQIFTAGTGGPNRPRHLVCADSGRDAGSVRHTHQLSNSL